MHLGHQEEDAAYDKAGGLLSPPVLPCDQKIKKYLKRLYVPGEDVEGIGSGGCVLLSFPSQRLGYGQKKKNRSVE